MSTFKKVVSVYLIGSMMVGAYFAHKLTKMMEGQSPTSVT